ncbi:Rho guanine nucleotide exchange factor 8 [Hibiscus syriacus]|uniref:Rho guanine nucleotide exchange factor 8 n=1 Tax=Hibiscus syriacus TaxID=106335 RepID=A0A6A3A2W5_HIBSY|nr:Rho guanine nucleotide exchange factor 8 [Hibiscus syriacus]
MLRSLSRRRSIQSYGSFRIGQTIDNAVEDNDHHQSTSIDARNYEQDTSMEEHRTLGECHKERPQSDLELMKERFAKLLLGEDMSGEASIFGEQGKLAPMSPERKATWRKEMDWLLSVTDHIVEFVPSEQKATDGTFMEIMVTKQRKDLLVNIPGLLKLDSLLIVRNRILLTWRLLMVLDEKRNFGTYPKATILRTETVEGKEMVASGAMAINAEVLSEIEVPESYIDSLPKNGRASLGDSIYRSITVEYFDPVQFLSTMDLSTKLRQNRGLDDYLEEENAPQRWNVALGFIH